tara:strand:+ start:494 stop:829 length:336 start_codon:yes stop_codon:yes gene_type:complete
MLKHQSQTNGDNDMIARQNDVTESNDEKNIVACLEHVSKTLTEMHAAKDRPDPVEMLAMGLVLSILAPNEKAFKDAVQTCDEFVKMANLDEAQVEQAKAEAIRITKNAQGE